jgi:hypothetical protein
LRILRIFAAVEGPFRNLLKLCGGVPIDGMEGGFLRTGRAAETRRAEIKRTAHREANFD